LTPEKRLSGAVELRLFRYTAVLFSLVALTALMVDVVWSFGWMLKAFYMLAPFPIPGRHPGPGALPRCGIS